MKRFSDIPSVVHAWAHQTYDECATYNGNVRYEGAVIFSYGSHFPMGRLLGKDKVLLTTRSYSNSTSNHMARARQAVFHMERHYCHNPENPLGRDAIFQTLVDIKAKIVNAARRRSPDLRDADVSSAQRMYDEIEWIRAWERKNSKQVEGLWGWRKWAQLDADLKKEWRALKAVLEQARVDTHKALNEITTAQIKADRLRLVKKQKQERLDTTLAKEALAEWQETGMRMVGFRRIKELMGFDGLRLTQGTDLKEIYEVVQTTQGLSVPADDCRKAWPLIKAAYARLDKTGIHVDFDTRTQASTRLGNFAPTGILRDGRLIVGCHAFTRESVENLAKALGVE